MQSNRCKGTSSQRLAWIGRMGLLLAALLFRADSSAAQVK